VGAPSGVETRIGDGAGPDLEEAYRRCETITRAAAANFYYGIRLLPAEKRRAMSAVYAFARRVDDIGDGPLEAREKLARLRALGDSLALAQSSRAGGTDPVLLALVDAATRFPLPLDALEELIEGVRMDVTGTTYETFDELVQYCRRVAGGIGRLCVAIFGARERSAAGTPGRAHPFTQMPPGDRATGLADELGVAMQLTNILRDLREDAEQGRVYVPAEELRAYGLARCRRPEELAALARISADAIPPVAAGEGGGDVGALFALMRFHGRRAEEHFSRGLELVGLLDRRSAACVLAMTGIYRSLLARIQAHPERSLARRMSLSSAEKAFVAARGILGSGA
jgi:15-cis-phytoene synthase